MMTREDWEKVVTVEEGVRRGLRGAGLVEPSEPVVKEVLRLMDWWRREHARIEAALAKTEEKA